MAFIVINESPFKLIKFANVNILPIPCVLLLKPSST